MVDNDKNREIATFRFGVIAEFVTGVKLDYGEKEKLITQKIARTYRIPYSNHSSISRSTINEWVSAYKNAGYRIEGLFPKTRKDKGSFRKLDPQIRLAIVQIKNEHPTCTLPTIIKKLKNMKVLREDEQLNMSTIYRFLKKENLSSSQPTDRRKFEASHPNEIWQCDIMHGPQAQINGVHKKTYLCAILDDHSRLITHAQFYQSETMTTLKDCLKKAVERRGLPQKFYVDNGACYKTIHLEQITAALGIGLSHSRPYTPQGRGKIERFFRSLRDSFLSLIDKVLTIEELNETLDNWLEEYHRTKHAGINTTPMERYQKNLECVRPAPKDLLAYFRFCEFRTVKKDRSLKLNGRLFEAPVALIDKRVELRYHKEEPEEVEVFLENCSFGMAVPLNPMVNAKVGRQWAPLPDRKKNCPPEIKNKTTTPTGKLFGGQKNEQI